MPTLDGTVALAGLPPHRGLIVNLCFFPVASADSPAPFGGDPPTESVTDCERVIEQADFNSEVDQPAYDLPFTIERPVGFYYLQVRVILFRAQAGKMFAQVEPYFFARRPLPLTDPPPGRVTLPVQWPQIPLEELGTDGFIEPRH